MHKHGDHEGLVEMGRDLEGVEVSVFLRETDKGYKASLRSNNYVNVAEVASIFSGGGHIRAAGCTLPYTLNLAKEKIVDRVNTEFEKYGEIPDETPVMDKMMGWTGVNLNTITDKSNSHIAEMMIQGGDMGIIECQKLLNHNPNADQEVKNILNDFTTMQKNNIEQMKKFL